MPRWYLQDIADADAALDQSSLSVLTQHPFLKKDSGLASWMQVSLRVCTSASVWDAAIVCMYVFMYICMNVTAWISQQCADNQYIFMYACKYVHCADRTLTADVFWLQKTIEINFFLCAHVCMHVYAWVCMYTYIVCVCAWVYVCSMFMCVPACITCITSIWRAWFLEQQICALIVYTFKSYICTRTLTHTNAHTAWLHTHTQCYHPTNTHMHMSRRWTTTLHWAQPSCNIQDNLKVSPTHWAACTHAKVPFWTGWFSSHIGHHRLIHGDPDS